MSAQLANTIAPDQSTAPQPSAAPVAIVVTRLAKSYELRPVLRAISFTLPAGHTLALLGPNGAGKTTLLRILATLLKPTSGSALVAGLDATRDADAIRHRIGYVGHQPHLYDELTARENLLFFARMYGLRDGPARADHLLDRVGLRAKSRDRVRGFSRGQLQRLALARGILHDPSILLLDEPDTGLDDEAATLLDTLIHDRAAHGLTTLLTTHQIERGLRLADHALVLAGGRLAYDGPSAALDLAAVRHLYGRARLTERPTEGSVSR